MYLMGLGGSIHDFSACLVKDGKIVNYIEDERITRVKHGDGLGLKLSQGFGRNYCCDMEQISIEQIDRIYANDILLPTLYKKLNRKVELINHHLSHAASCYYLSPYEKSAILVIDSVGSKFEKNGKIEYETVSIFKGEDKQITRLGGISGRNITGTDNVENSLGVFYTVMTQLAGFEEFQEGKLMGLAPYGTDNFYNLIRQHVRLKEDGQIEIKEEDLDMLKSYGRYIDEKKKEDEKFEVRAAFAWAAQTVLEESIIHICNYVKELTGLETVCLAGGVMLNSVTNYRLYKEKIFKHIFLQPACGDGGTAIGSALYGYYSNLA